MDHGPENLHQRIEWKRAGQLAGHPLLWKDWNSQASGSEDWEVLGHGVQTGNLSDLKARITNGVTRQGPNQVGLDRHGDF